jgi:choline-sulfatase
VSVISQIRLLVCVACIAATSLAQTPAPTPTPTPTPTPAPPNIVLITLDTTRADRMGFLGSKLGLTPNLDALATDSTIFKRAYSQVPLTAPSHATILTGTYPQFHHVNDFQVPLASDLPYAPAILHDHGYLTAAFVGAMILDPGVGFARGFDRGFDKYDAGFHQSRPGEDRYSSTERRGGEVVSHALAWLDEHPKGPFFVWLHLYDAHDPYDPPEPFKTKYATSPYDGEIAYSDSVVGKFLTELRTRGLYDGAVIAVMADHGEALGEHGEDTHGFFLYDETIRVPLLIKLPAAGAPEKNSQEKLSTTKDSAGKNIETRVGLVDVLPTLLQAAGLATPREVQGESLLSAMTSGATAAAAPDRSSYAESDYGQRTYGWASLRSLRTGKYLYVKAPRQELYDQSADPKAEHDLSTVSTAVTTTLAAQLDAFRQKTSSNREAPTSAVDPAAQQKLAALGYVASSDSASRPGAKDLGADPKDKIAIANLIHRTYLLIDAKRYAEAVPLLQDLIVKEPDTPLAYAQLGECLVALKQYPQAVPILRKAVALRPDMTLPHFQLAESLLDTNDLSGAIPELEIVVARVPHWEEAHQMLQMAYAQTGQMEKAIAECRKVLAFDADDYRTNLLLGRLLQLTGKPSAALQPLKKAAALDPNAPEPHLFLKDAYEKLGRKTDAAREQAAAKRLAP